MTQSSAQAYSMELANTLTKITMEKFFKKIHNRFYPDQDVSFMKYFLELTQHECEFIVPHKKLIEYGIMTSTESSAAKKKFAMLNLEKDEDYTLEDVSERGTSGAQTHKVYHLTPEAFKKCLMRAQRRPKQEVDPVIYCDYYLLLEKVFKLYTDYERQYAKCLLEIKDDKIDKLLIENQEQSKKIDQLLSHTTHIIIQNDKQSIEIKHLNDKIDILFDYFFDSCK